MKGPGGLFVSDFDKDSLGQSAIGIGEEGGIISLAGKDGKEVVSILVNKDGKGVVGAKNKDGEGGVAISTDEHGGFVGVYGKGSSFPRATMDVNE